MATEHGGDPSEALPDLLDAPGVLRTLFANVPSAIAVFSAAGQCLVVNPAYLRLFGSAPPPDYNLWKDELIARLGALPLVRRALAGETVTSPGVWYDPKQLEHIAVIDANRVGLEVTCFPLSTRPGAIDHLGVTYRDVTAELTARDETAAERDRLRAIVEQSGEGITVVDADGVTRLINRAAELQQGALPSEAPLGRAIRGERVESSWQVRPPGAAPRVLEGTATPLRRPDGSVAGAILITRDITERRRTEDELRLQSRILDNISEGVSVSDEHGVIRYTNPAEDAMFGYARGELLGQHVTVQNAYPPEENARIVAAVTQRLREVGEWSGEWKNRKKDGTSFTTRARITSLEIGGAPHWVCVQEDVTEEVRARAEAQRLAAELRRSEDHYKATVNLNSQVSWTATPDGGLATLSDRWYALTGVPPEDALGKGWVQAMHPDDVALSVAEWARSLATGVPYDVEHRIRHADGEMRWMRTRAHARTDDSGHIVRWYGTMDDVHDRRLAEAALLDSERFWRELVENLPELAWTALADGHIDFYNRRFYEYTGTTFAEMEGWGWRALQDPALLPEVEARWTQSIASGEPFEMEFPLRGADGTFRWFLTRVRPLRGADGRIVRWFGTNTNIDEQRRQAAALREAIEVRDTFISVASHELNTPLTTLLLRAQALMAALEKRAIAELAERVVRDVEAMRRQVLRLSSLVGGMLDVSRIGVGRLTLHLEEADLAALVRETVWTFGPEAERLAVALELDTPGPIVAMWDPTRCGQIVANLLSNALRYGATRPVKVSLVTAGDDAVLRVADQGIGIPEAAQQRIFDKFERAVSERHYGGLGLGLYVTRQLVHEMGGTIVLASEPNVGTVVTVTLPIRAPRSPLAPQPQP